MKLTEGLLGIIWLAWNLFATASVDAAINDVCQTSDGSRGLCIAFTDCPRLFALYSQPRPLPAAIIRLLRSEQCGFVNTTPLVCCDDIPATTVLPDTKTPFTTDEGVSSHRNVGLINPELCGQTFVPRLLVGNKTDVFEYPWMALLKYRSSNGRKVVKSFKCGATLINSRYVLTAAQCISNSRRLKLLSVRLGEHNLSTDEDYEDWLGTRECAPPPQDINIEKTIRHPLYNSTTLVNDIALIRLAVPANDSVDTVNPICLPVGVGEENKNLDHKRMIVTGWGLSERGSSRAKLLKVYLPVMPTETCQSVFQRFNLQVSPNQLCAGGTNFMQQDSCSGDSGGPLVDYGRVNGEMSTIQYGVVSYAHRHCGTEGVPGVYTRVGPYMSWILDNMEP